MKKQRVLKDHFEEAPDSLLREFWKALQRMVNGHCMLGKLQEVQYCIQDCSTKQARPDNDSYDKEFGLFLRSVGGS